MFEKMRRLHERLDEKKQNATEEEQYVNDCIKIIMDGGIPEPADRHQVLCAVAGLRARTYVRSLRREAEGIAKKLADDIRVDRRRIMTNIVQQSVMKYTRQEELEEDLHEAIRIAFSRDGQPKVIHAAQSNATILHGLVDKALLLFHTFYVPSREESLEKVNLVKDQIRDGFQEFVSQHFGVSKRPCGCMGGEHMCQLNPENEADRHKTAQRARNPGFICVRCGRVADQSEFLCEAVEIKA
ncbi:MAG TPA: hypothetical protein ENN87_06410 [Phycisphaerales bacterium]|nr:hypothetical protein [Phycisphaerales bacterium]